MEKVTDGPVGRGTMYRAKWKGSPQIEVEYVHFDRPHSWRAHSDGSMETHFQCTVEQHADGAKVMTELELIPHGFFKLVFPIFKLLFSKAEKAGAEQDARDAEQALRSRRTHASTVRLTHPCQGPAARAA